MAADVLSCILVILYQGIQCNTILRHNSGGRQQGNQRLSVSLHEAKDLNTASGLEQLYQPLGHKIGMDATSKERALRVCRICKQRKKHCDKQLPRCGYCSGRNLKCDYSYDLPASKESDDRFSGGHFPALPSTIPASAWVWQPTWNALQSSAVPMQMSSLGNTSPNSSIEPMTFDMMIHVQVCQIFQLTNQSLREITTRFFRDFHQWLPVVSPRFLEKRVAEAHSQGKNLPADLSLLLLAMSLVTLHPSKSTSEGVINPENLSSMVRTLFAQVQAVVCASTALVQASLLISAYDYASGRTDAAYISMGTCAKMAYVLGLDQDNRSRSDVPHGEESKIRALEDWNVWWGVVVLERFIAFDINFRSLRLVTEYPGIDAHLPSDLGAGLPVGLLPFCAKSLDTPPLSATHANTLSSFAGQAQGVHLFDQVLRIISLPGVEDSKLLELRRLDRQLQSFLSVIIRESGGLWGYYCGALAIAIKSLFLLHEHILAQLTTSEIDTASIQWRESSHSALNTVSKMVVDAATHHMQNGSIDEVPLCCVHNIRAAKKQIQTHGDHMGIEKASESLRPLLAMEKAFCERWRPAVRGAEH